MDGVNLPSGGTVHRLDASTDDANELRTFIDAEWARMLERVELPAVSPPQWDLTRNLWLRWVMRCAETYRSRLRRVGARRRRARVVRAQGRRNA